jgi:chemotaxis protein MotA
MFAIIGILAVFGAIVGGYLMEHGNLMVLVQPAELLIIFGAALGTVLIANPLPVLIAIAKGIGGVFGGSRFSKGFYLDQLKMIYELYNYARKSGTAKLEEDIDKPDKSQIFSKYPKFLKDHHAVAFLCDTLRNRFHDGNRSGSAPFRVRPARCGAHHHGGRASRSGNRGGRAWRVHHHGLAGRTERRNRA